MEVNGIFVSIKNIQALSLNLYKLANYISILYPSIFGFNWPAIFHFGFCYTLLINLWSGSKWKHKKLWPFQWLWQAWPQLWLAFHEWRLLSLLAIFLILLYFFLLLVVFMKISQCFGHQHGGWDGQSHYFD